MTVGRRTQDKKVTVGASSVIATITVTGSDCTGDNKSEFILREDEDLLSCIERVMFIVRKGRDTELCRESKVYCEEGKRY
jgi:hypothetical protein